MIVSLYKQFGQGIAVGGCALMSFTTLSYMMCDSHRISRKMLINQYEEKIKTLHIEIESLKSKK